MASLQDISAMISARKPADAAAALQKLVKKKAKAGVNWQSAMQLAASLGDHETALIAAQNFASEAPQNPHRIVVLIDALGAVAKHEEAAKLARQLQTNPAAAADGYYLEGVFQARLGRREKALTLLRKAIAAHAAHPAAWEQIALLNGYEDFNYDLQAMQDLTRQIKQPEFLATLHYALGRAYDYADATDQAFQAYAVGAELRGKTAPYQPQPLIAYLDRRPQIFTPEFIRDLQSDSGGENLIFIVSAPRSGTTLVEQILATAPGVTPSGEHTLMRLATLRIGSMEPPDAPVMRALKTSDWRKMAQGFETSLRRRFGPGERYTDKTMLNANYCGLFKILFPKAKVIWCKRDPRDITWSAYRSRLSGNRWAQDLNHCAEYVAAHERLCHYWASIYGENFKTVAYEELVSDPETSSAALFSHTALDRPDNWRDFHKSESAVATASLAQVRQPLNAKAVGSWRRYEKQLAPVYDRYFS